ncbi:MAG: MATE family efflux transporter [Oscillospiraceae bacterium]|nr:MATE family efflux transporter [Oscillospiraceae bacterium]
MNPKENKLGTMPIGRLLISMSIPMMISFFIQALYNIVDSMFVARISEDALTAVSIAFPLQQVITAIAVGTGVGVNALVPRFVGRGDLHTARRIANVAVFLSACYTLVFAIIGLTAIHSFYTMQTDVPAIVEAGTQYLTIVCTICIGAFFGQNFEKLLVATGNTLCSMAAQATGAVFNIIFDPLLIFGIGPFPQLGVRGAAIATVSGQIVATIVAYCMLRWKEKNIPLSFRYMLPSLPVLKDIFSIAIPSMITVGLTSAMSFCMNQILLAFSTTATAVFGIWLKLQNFSYMPIFGMNNGTIPMISYNYGANRMDRVRETIRLALKVAVMLMAVLTIIFECIPGVLLMLFSASENMIAIGTIALRLLVLSLPLGAVCLIISSSFQSLGYSRYTLIVNLCRQLIFLIPIALAMSITGNLSLVWIAPALAEALSVLATLYFRRKLNAVFDL